MARGIKSLKQEKIVGSKVYLLVDQWIEGSNTSDKIGNITWLCFAQNKKDLLDKRVLNAKDSYIITIPPKLAGSYKYYVEASLGGTKEIGKDPGLFVYGKVPKKVIYSKWCKTPDGEDCRKTYHFSYGHRIYLGLNTEGLNGDTVIIDVYRTKQGGKGSKDDQYMATYNGVKVIDGEINLKIGDTYRWFTKIPKPKSVEEFYVKVKSSGRYVTDGKDDIHARFLRIKNEVVSKAIELPTNHTPTKVGKPEISLKRYESCRYDKIIIKEKDSNKEVSDFTIYDRINPKKLIPYETLAPSNDAKKTIEIDIENITNKGCFTKTHKKEIEIFINGQNQKTEIISGGKISLPVQAKADKLLLRTSAVLFFITPDRPNVYKLITKTCAQPNNPFYIYVYPNVEREIAFILTLFPGYNRENNVKISQQESLSTYDSDKGLKLVRNVKETLIQTKGGFGIALQAKVKVDNIESIIELAQTRNQIKKLIDFFYRVKEVLEPFNGAKAEGTPDKYIRRPGLKWTFDIEPPNVALALRMTNKKLQKTNDVVIQYSGGLALKPIIKFKFSLDILSLLQYFGLGGKIADFLKEKLEKKYDFTLYVIVEASLEARAEITLNYNKIEGFGPGKRKLEVLAVLTVKGGAKATGDKNMVVVYVPEADGKMQKVKVEKWKAEALATAGIMYTYEVNADQKLPYSQHKLEFTGLKATLIFYSIRQGMQYNESFKKEFTIIPKPDEPWYKSEKQHLI